MKVSIQISYDDDDARFAQCEMRRGDGRLDINGPLDHVLTRVWEELKTATRSARALDTPRRVRR